MKPTNQTGRLLPRKPGTTLSLLIFTCACLGSVNAQQKMQTDSQLQLPAEQRKVIDKEKLEKDNVEKDDKAGAVTPSNLKEKKIRQKLPAVQKDKLPAVQKDKLPAVQKDKLPAVQKDKLPAVQKRSMEGMEPAKGKPGDHPGTKQPGTAGGFAPQPQLEKPKTAPTMEKKRPDLKEAPGTGGFVPRDAVTKQPNKSRETSGSGLSTPTIESEKYREIADDVRQRIPEHSPEWSARQDDGNSEPSEAPAASSTRITEHADGRVSVRPAQTLTVTGLGSRSVETGEFTPLTIRPSETLAVTGLGSTDVTSATFEPLTINVTTPLTITGTGE